MEDRSHPADEPLVDFRGLPARLGTAAGALGALALLGCVADGVVNGLTFALMARWAGLYLAAMLVVAAATTAVHALGGADRAGRRGERLSAPDVGLAPRKLGEAHEARRAAFAQRDAAAAEGGADDEAALGEAALDDERRA